MPRWSWSAVGSVTRAGALLLALAVGPAARAAGPSVLLVSIDSLRADRTSVHGNVRRTTPALERLAADGVAFLEAYSPTSWTLPAHATLLTGLRQDRHGVITPADRLSPSTDALAGAFGRAGYETAGFYSGPFLHPAYGFADGFDRYESCEGDAARDPTDRASWQASHTDRTGRCLARAVSRWARRRSAGPYFAFVHFWDVHYDYVPPERFAAPWTRGYRGPLDGRDIAGAGFPLDAAPRDVAHLLALYDAEIRWTDAVLGRILRVLERRGMLDDTLVVVTADHGEEFLDHGGKGHQHTLHDELVHVPLVFWSPARIPRGRRIDAPVSLADVAPTILAIAGAPGLADVTGRSLVGLMEGRVVGTRPALAALYHPHDGRLLEVAVHAPRQRFVGRIVGGDVAPRRDVTRTVDHDVDVAWIARRWAAAAGSAQRRGRGGGPVPAELPADVTERLRALGYLAGE